MEKIEQAWPVLWCYLLQDAMMRLLQRKRHLRAPQLLEKFSRYLGPEGRGEVIKGLLDSRRTSTRETIAALITRLRGKVVR